MTFKCPSRSSVIKSGTNRISLNSLNLICMHGRVLEIQEKLQLCPWNASRVQSVTSYYSSSSWNALNRLSSYRYRLIYMYVLTQVWRPCRDVIFHVWLKQTIRIFLPCKFTAECINKRIFIILEVGIFQNQNCDFVSVMVCYLPAICSVIFQVLHFPALRFGPLFSRSCIFQSLIFFGPSFSGPANSAPPLLSDFRNPKALLIRNRS